MRRDLAVPVFVAMLAGCVPAKSAEKYEPPDERFVLFTPASADVTSADGYFALGYVTAMLEEHPTYRVLVVGHADTSGASDRNRDLCYRRARNVRKILLSHGVTETRVTIAAALNADSGTAAMLSRRTDVYLFDPAVDDVAKRLGYPIEQKNE